jgi:hypothetical protein
MKLIIRMVAISMLMFFVAPAWSASAVHLFHCIAEDKTTDEALEAVASEWLAAGKQLKGGKNLKIFLYYPVAVGASDHDFSFMVILPDFEQMGVFMDAYSGSPLEEIDDRFDELAHCPISDLWEAVPAK